jgi:uncharacterized protein YkwD
MKSVTILILAFACTHAVTSQLADETDSIVPEEILSDTTIPSVRVDETHADALLQAATFGQSSDRMGKKPRQWKLDLIKAHKENPTICKDWMNSENCERLRKKYKTCAVGFYCGKGDISVSMKKACCGTCKKDYKLFCTKDRYDWCRHVTGPGNGNFSRKKNCRNVKSGRRRRPWRSSFVKQVCSSGCDSKCPSELKTRVTGKQQSEVITAAREETLAESVLRTTNMFRCMHGVPPVKWSSAVAKSAQEWANKGKYEHSKSYAVPSPAGPAGENLALGHETIAQANWAWYNEVKDCVKFPGCKGPKGKGKKGATGLRRQEVGSR